MSRRIFWTEAMKGGSVIGVVVAVLLLLRQSLQLGAWSGMLSLAAFVFLMVLFTRRVAEYASPQEGFPYGKCMSFALAMMLFTGVIVGFATWIINNYMMREQIAELVDMQMASMQDLLPKQQFDMLYDMTYSAMFNPLVLVAVGVISYCVQGGVIALFTSVMTQVKPDPFAETDPDAPEETQSDLPYEA